MWMLNVDVDHQELGTILGVLHFQYLHGLVPHKEHIRISIDIESNAHIMIMSMNALNTLSLDLPTRGFVTPWTRC